MQILTNYVGLFSKSNSVISSVSSDSNDPKFSRFGGVDNSPHLGLDDIFKLKLRRRQTGSEEKLNDNELKAVIAHEIAHIVNGDVKVLAIANFFVTLSSFLMQMFCWNMLFGGIGRSRENNGSGQAIFLLYIVTYFFQLS